MKSGKKFLIFFLVLAIFVVVLLSTRCDKRDETQNTQGERCPVIITEVVTSNKGVIMAPDGSPTDYIEFLNTGDTAYAMDGFALSDREDKMWVIPAGTVIEPHSYMIVWCTGNASSAGNIADFKLSTGDVLRYTDPSGNILLQMELPDIFSGNAYLYDMESSTWSEGDPSPGYPNTAEGILAFQQSKQQTSEGLAISNGVYISEFMADNGGTLALPDGSFGDWIELHNTTAQAVNLAGHGLSDSMEKPFKFIFPDSELSVIPAGGYLLVYCTTERVNGYLCASFGLSSLGETLLLSAPGGGILDSVSFGAQTMDHSCIRPFDDNGSMQIYADFMETDLPSPGYPNTYAGWSAFDANRYQDLGVHDITITEVLNAGYTYYVNANGRPTDNYLGEWAELHNASDAFMNLTGYSLADKPGAAGKWVFPEGTGIAGKGYLVVLLKDGTAPDQSQSYLELDFDLNDAGETLYLFDPSGVLIDRVQLPQSHAGVSVARMADGSWGLSEQPTPGAANTNTRSGRCETPAFSVSGGLYHEAQYVTITVPEGCYVTYTTNCDDPKAGDTRYTAGQTISVTENMVLRARAFDNADARYASDIASVTYVIVGNEQTYEAHDTEMNMIFLVTDPKNLFDPSIGIYVLGNDYQAGSPAWQPTDWTHKWATSTKGANFNQRGRSWERQTHFSYTSKGGEEILFEQEVLLRIFGAYSRARNQKGLGIIARKGYGGSSLDYAFFEDYNRPFTSYNSLVLRAGANDNNRTKMRDVLVQSLLEDAGMNMATQAFIPCAVYLNGKYWGMYYLREKISRSFFAQHYGVQDPDSIDVLVGEGKVTSAGDPNAAAEYQALIQFCKDRNSKLSAEDYEYLCRYIDVENFALYIAQEIAVGNTDTGNIKFWRSSELDGKWRWQVYDYCWGFNGDDSNPIETTTGYRRDFFTRYLHVDGHGANKGFSTVLARSLLSRNEFVEIFLRYCALMVNEVYSTAAVNNKVDELRDLIKSEIYWDFTRWGLTTAMWDSVLDTENRYADHHTDKIRLQADNYPEYFLKYVQNWINNNTNYDLTDAKMIEIFGRKSSL